MTFNEALKKLGIEDFGERIFNSNAHGELFHLADYILLAKSVKDVSWFRPWFLSVVAVAEQDWERPDSIFQHIGTILAKGAKA